MQKISFKKFIQISIIIFAILLYIFTISNWQNTDVVVDQQNIFLTEKGFTDSNKISGPRGGQPDTEIILKSVAPSTKSIPGMDTVVKTENSVIQKDSISLIAGDTNVKLKITSGQTLYEILQNEENKKLISFTGKKYTGIGFFVTDIGNLHQGDGKYLMYDINGIEASSGISDYVPKNGDIVEWKLK